MQCLFTVKSNDVESPMTSIAWSPDGFFLSVGHENGEISIYDIEKEGIVTSNDDNHKTSKESSHISNIQWIKCRDSPLFESDIDRAESLLMAPPSFKVENGHSSFGTVEKTFARMPEMPRVLTYFVSSDKNGNVKIYAMGTLVIASIDVCESDVSRIS